MSVYLREPKDQIYIQEKMPFIFSSTRIEGMAQEITSQVDRNAEEAALFGKKTPAILSTTNLRARSEVTSAVSRTRPTTSNKPVLRCDPVELEASPYSRKRHSIPLRNMNSMIRKPTPGLEAELFSADGTVIEGAGAPATVKSAFDLSGTSVHHLLR